MSIIKKDEIIESGLFVEAAKNAKVFAAELEKIEKSYKELLQATKEKIQATDANTAKGISDQNKQINEAKIKIAELNKVQKTRIRLTERLANSEKEEAKEIINLREQIKQKNKEGRREAVINNEIGGSYKVLSTRLNKLRDEYKDLAIQEKQNTKEARNLLKEITSLDSKLKEVDETVGQSQRNVGNYSSAFGTLGGVLQKVGIAIGLIEVKNLILDLNDLANEARGVQFAFNRLGEEGQDAFEKIKASTRGTLSNLDIKRSLVEFDNFNISLKETDVLFEFLAVRAAQTGKSVESLQSSLVEGLSKQSKLRIDNLGISTKQLNEELEKTPNFVQAVANIAKREIAEAGDILDETTSSQAKWNTRIQNTKETIARGLQPVLNAFFSTLNFIADNFRILVAVVTPLVTAFSLYRIQLLLLNKESKLNLILTKAQALGTTILSTVTGLLSGKIKIATLASRAFNTVLKLNPIGLLITGITTVLALLPLFSNETKELTEEQKKLNKELEREIELRNQRISAGKSLIDSFKEIQGVSKDISKLSQDQLKSFINDVDSQIEANKRKNFEVSNRDRKTSDQSLIRARRIGTQINIIEKDLLDDNFKNFEEKFNAQQNLNQLKISLNSDLTDRLVKGEEGLTKSTSDEILKRLVLLKKEAESRLKNNSERISFLKTLKNELSDVEKQREFALNSGEDSLSPRFIKLTAEAEELRKKIKELQDILKGTNQTPLDKLQDELKKVQQERESLLETPEDSLSPKFDDLTTRAERLTIRIKELQEVLKLKPDVELENTESAKIDVVLEVKDVDFNEDVSEVQTEIAESLLKGFKDIEDEKIKKAKETYEAINNAADALAQADQFRSEQKLKRIQEEETGAQNQADYLRQLAANGSQSAIDNLAFENKKIAELQRERQKEEERARKIEIGLAAVKSYVTALDQPGATPLSALTQSTGGITALLSFINSLPGFYEGTESVANDLQGNKFSNGRDGYLVKVDGSERVMTGQQNAMLGNISNDQLASLGQMYNHGLISPNEITPMINMQTQKIDLGGIEKAIESGISKIDIPKVGYEYDQLSNILTQVVTSKKFVNTIKQKMRFND